VDAVRGHCLAKMATAGKMTCCTSMKAWTMLDVCRHACCKCLLDISVQTLESWLSYDWAKAGQCSLWPAALAWGGHTLCRVIAALVKLSARLLVFDHLLCGMLCSWFVNLLCHSLWLPTSHKRYVGYLTCQYQIHRCFSSPRGVWPLGRVHCTVCSSG